LHLHGSRHPLSYLPYLSIVHVCAAFYSLSLHDALPIFFQRFAKQVAGNAGNAVALLDGKLGDGKIAAVAADERDVRAMQRGNKRDRKSTRLNSSHGSISYAVFCLKKKIKRTRKAVV